MSKHCPEKFDKIGDLSVKIEMKFENVMRWKLMNVMVAFMELYERKKLKMLSKNGVSSHVVRHWFVSEEP